MYAGLLLLLILASGTEPASAQPAAPQPPLRMNPAKPPPSRHVLSVGTGVAGCTNPDMPVYPLPDLRAQWHYRFQSFSMGLHFAMQFAHPAWNTEDNRVVLWNLVLGPELRLHRRWRAVELWTALVFGYVHQQEEHWFAGSADVHIHAGPGLGGGIGVDYHLHRRVALGLGFWVYKGWTLRSCYRTSGRKKWDCSEGDPYFLGPMLSGGINLRLAL